MKSAKEQEPQERGFRPEDYSRFLIREFLKKNGFEKTYDSFIKEDTRQKVTMTKNELTRLLGIDALMRRNAKSKVFNTMLDILCDFLILTKEASANGRGVQYPTTSVSQITPSKTSGNDSSSSKPPDARPKTGVPPAGQVRPQTSGGPGVGARTQANFFNPSLSSKPQPLVNAFSAFPQSAGSSADISEQNIDLQPGVLNKQASKQNLTKNNGFTHMAPLGGAGDIGSEDIYGTSTAAGTSKPQINFNRESGSNLGEGNSFRESSGIGGSIKQTATKLREPILLNQPSADEFAQVEGAGGLNHAGQFDPHDSGPGMKNKVVRNREAGTLGTSPDHFQMGPGMTGAPDYEWDNDHQNERRNLGFTRDIEDENPNIPIMGVGSQNAPGQTNFARRPQTSHGRGRKTNQQRADGIKKREAKHAGLGETSKDVWSIEDEDDLSRQQIMLEKKQAQKQHEDEFGRSPNAYVGGGTGSRQTSGAMTEIKQPGDSLTTGGGFRRGAKPQTGKKKNVASGGTKQKPKTNTNFPGDDLDDLDDLMGGDGGDANAEEMDFFGDNDRDDSIPVGKSKKKKGKQEDDDPLAFLQRARQEKLDNAQKKAMLEQEAAANWKSIEELNYNLKSKFMEQEDKWKMHLGADLYKEKPNVLAVDPSMRSRISQATREEAITREESAGMASLLFKDGKGHLHDSWKQGFYFDDNLKYGIFQGQGGPCGILATVQAFFLKHLLYGMKCPLHYLGQKNMDNQIQNCLALAISDILYNASNDGETKACLVVPQGSISSNQSPVQPYQCSKVYLQKANDFALIYNLVKCYLNLFNCANSQGVILLVYSCILTRGIAKIKGDMDLEGSTLLNEHGYASQEVINLMLVGAAKSNVHDGDKDLGDGFVLKGVEKQADVGFLTFFEAFGYFQVGEYLKTPRLPIWIVCSESHYTILFAVDSNLLTNPEGEFDLVYYDELARQEHDIILTVSPGQYKGPSASNNKTPIPVDEVIRTKWAGGQVHWNGRTVIL